MLRIPVKEGENIDRALKRYKRKFVKTTIKNQLQERKQFTKPSVARRAQVQKGIAGETYTKYWEGALSKHFYADVGAPCHAPHDNL